jgi:AcrR family transcriptional regulator
LPASAQLLWEPRKSPVQARSAASVDAILEATIQVLLKVGKERLTTTRVAERAGVSVETLYQYFPNKSALLRAVLRRHFDQVLEAVEQACREQHGKTVEQMATALITAFLGAKMRKPQTSVALYSVSADVDGAKIVKQMVTRMNQAMVAMLASARQPLTQDPLIKDPQLIANLLQGAMSGVSRQLLESPNPEERFATLRDELIFLATAYLNASIASPTRKSTHTPAVNKDTSTGSITCPGDLVTGRGNLWRSIS